jgi:hypothetical protein
MGGRLAHMEWQRLCLREFNISTSGERTPTSMSTNGSVRRPPAHHPFGEFRIVVEREFHIHSASLSSDIG